VGQAFARALEILVGTGVEFSPLALYYEFRRASGFPVTEDSGAYMEPSVKALAAYGAGSEALWPYVVSRFAEQPPASYRAQALDHRVLNWYRATGVDEAKSALAAGFPCVSAFDVPPGFDRVGETGMWIDTGGRAIGGHAVLFYGYDDSDERFRVMNSWGPEWGDDGTFLLPYAAFAKQGGRWWDGLVVTLLDEEAGR